jgi:hypothetical protein
MPVATALRVTHWRRESVISSPCTQLIDRYNKFQFINHVPLMNTGKPEPKAKDWPVMGRAQDG